MIGRLDGWRIYSADENFREKFNLEKVFDNFDVKFRDRLLET
jgi:hypothetical protein